MKIILSRKGFDSSAGGCASPILEDGTLVSLPIPERRAPSTYADVQIGNETMAQLVADLTGGTVTGATRAHVDPDLRAGALARAAGWMPMFGQTDRAQAHLDRHQVGPGDLFLFFGWFREIEPRDGRFRFVPDAPDLHVLFGWLRVGEVWRGPGPANAPRWAYQHPHVAADYGPSSTIYVAAGSDGEPDAGFFPHGRDELILTAPGGPRSRWRLPDWLYPKGDHPALSYHGRPSRWERRAGKTLLRSVARGQEFVLDADDYAEANEWSRLLIDAGRASRAAVA